MNFSFDVVFMRRSKKRDWFSWMTTLTEGVDHAAIRLVDWDGNLKLFHAIGDGEQLMDDAAYMAEHEDVEIFRLDAWADPTDIYDYIRMRDKLRTKYSMRQILVNQVARFIGLGVLPIKNGDKAVICCETAARFVQKFAKFSGDLDMLDGIGLKEFRDVLANASEREVRRIK